MGKVYDLSIGMYFLYMWCTRNGAIGLVTLQTADILGLIMFRNTFPRIE